MFNQGLAQSGSFRTMIFNQYAQRLSDVIHLVEGLSFGRIETRLAEALLQQAETSKLQLIHTTHQNLAAELGSAREVIGRHLKQLEKNGVINLHRGCIEIIKLDDLKKRAEN